jgi:tetratricopeptide (TPR) repeat protein
VIALGCRALFRNRVPALSTAALLAALLGSARAARAEDTSGGAARVVSAEDRRQAKERYREGVEAYEAGLYQLSIEYFAAADRLAPSAALSFNIARAHEKLGQAAAAVAAYRDYLRREPDSESAGVARQRIAALEPRSGPNRDDRGAAAEAARTGGANRTDPGESASSDLDLVAGEPARASLSGAAPLVPPAAERPALGVWPLVALSAGGAALITAGVFEIMRRDAEGEARTASRRNEEGGQSPHSQVDVGALRDTAESRQTAAQLSFGVGAALLMTGGVMLLVDRRPTRTPSTSAGLSVAPGRVAASMTARF